MLNPTMLEEQEPVVSPMRNAKRAFVNYGGRIIAAALLSSSISCMNATPSNLNLSRQKPPVTSLKTDTIVTNDQIANMVLLNSKMTLESGRELGLWGTNSVFIGNQDTVILSGPKNVILLSKGLNFIISNPNSENYDPIYNISVVNTDQNGIELRSFGLFAEADSNPIQGVLKVTQGIIAQHTEDKVNLVLQGDDGNFYTNDDILTQGAGAEHLAGLTTLALGFDINRLIPIEEN